MPYQVAVALEKAALSDEYFIKRKLYPNVDFYSGLIYRYISCFFQTEYTLIPHPSIPFLLLQYLNCDLLIFRAMGFPTEFFPVLFAIPRMAGWLAHWKESLDDPDNKIMRPQQVSSYQQIYVDYLFFLVLNSGTTRVFFCQPILSPSLSYYSLTRSMKYKCCYMFLILVSVIWRS